MKTPPALFRFSATRACISSMLAATALAAAAPTMEDFYLREEIPLPEGEVMEGASISIIDDKRVKKLVAGPQRALSVASSFFTHSKPQTPRD